MRAIGASLLVTGLLLAAIPGATAQSQSPEITLDPTSGLPQATIDVSGTGWSSDVTVQVYFDQNDPGTFPPVATATTDGGGGFNTTFLVPSDRQPGNYLVLACVGCPLESGDSATASFTLLSAPTATISLNPTSGSPGDTIAVTGVAWLPKAPLDIYFDANDPSNDVPPVVSPTTDGQGNFSDSFAVPDRGAGSYTVLACQYCLIEQGPEATADFTLVIAPPPAASISLRPTAGSPGDTIAVTGAGWTPGSDVAIYLDAQDPANQIPALVPDATADGNGALSTSFIVPTGRDAGTYTVLACQGCPIDSGPSATATFQLKAAPPPTMKLNPRTGSPGNTITVTGTGWTPQAPVNVFFDQGDPANGVAPVATATPAGDGTVSTSFVVPDRDDGPGRYTLLACQICPPESGPQATARFTLKALSSAPSITLDPRTGSPGDTITVSGAGWTPQATVSVFFDQGDLAGGVSPLVSTTADADGAISTTFVLPSGRNEGPYTVLACEDCDGTAPRTALAPLSLIAVLPTSGSESGHRSIVPAVILLILALALTGGLLVFLRQTTRWKRPGWERAAEDDERTESCQGRRWYCRRGEPQFDAHLRGVASVAVAVRVPGRDEPEQELEIQDGVDLLNDALLADRAHLLAGTASTVVDAATDLVWRQIERQVDRADGQELEVVLDMEASEGSCPYTLYHCERDGVGRRWRERATWTGKIQSQASCPVTTLPYGMFEANDPRGDLSGALVAALAAVAQGKVDHRLKAGHEFELSH